MSSLQKTIFIIAGLSGAALLLAGYSYNVQKSTQVNDTMVKTTPSPSPTPKNVTTPSPSTMGSESYTLQGATGTTTPAPSTKDDIDSMQRDINAVQIDTDFGAKVQ